MKDLGSADYQWGAIHGAERMLMSLLRDYAHYRDPAFILNAMRKQLEGVRLIREVLTERQEVRDASHPHWPSMLKP